MPDQNFSQMIRSHRLTASSFARLIKSLGDPADAPTIERRVRRWISGDAKAPGEAIALLTLIGRVRGATASLQDVLPADE